MTTFILHLFAALAEKERALISNMIRVAMSENEMLELMRRMAKPTNRPEGGHLLAWEPSVDACQSVIAFHQESFANPLG